MELDIITRSEWDACGTVPRDPTDKDEIALHHSVDPNRQWTFAQEIAHMRAICRDHLERDFSTIGYSFVVFPSGRIYSGRGWRGIPAGQEGQNSGTWALCGIGDFRTVEPSMPMRRSLRAMILILRDEFGAMHLGGHTEFPHQETECPGMRMLEYAAKWREEFGLARPERS